LGIELGRNVIGEGVDSYALHAVLAQEGCGSYQG